MATPMHDRGQHVPAPAVVPARPAREQTPHEQLAALASAAGNRAVSRLLQRDEDPGAAPAGPIQFTQPAKPPIGLPQLDPDYVAKQQDAFMARVREYLTKQREVLLAQIGKGMPMTELVDDVRQSVPDATKLALQQIEGLIRGAFDGVQIPAHRPSGTSGWDNTELAAIVRNVMGIKAQLAIERPHGWVKLSLSGYEVGLRKGDAEVSSEVGWDRSFGAKGKVGAVHFGALVKPPDKPGGNVTWEAQLAFPEEGAMVPMLDGLGGMMGSANRAMTGLAGDALSRGMPPVEQITKAFEPVKEAMSGLGAIAKANRPTFGVKVTGDGPGITVQATLTVPF